MYLHDKVDSEVINQGGNVEIYGHVDTLNKQSGKAYIDGVADKSIGQIEFKKALPHQLQTVTEKILLVTEDQSIGGNLLQPKTW